MSSPPENRDAYLDSVLIGGREPASIVIVNFDATWPERYAELRRRVERALGEAALSVEHIGSTSVPGLAAKPIIDMLLTVRSVDAEAEYVEALEQAGFVQRGRTAEDRRLVLVRILPAGLELLTRLDTPVLELHKKTLAHLNYEELAQLNNLLVKVRQGISPE